MDEARKIFADRKARMNTPKQQTKQKKEFQNTVKKWQQYFEENKGKIPNPDSVFKTVFDRETKTETKNTNEIKKFSKLIDDAFEY